MCAGRSVWWLVSCADELREGDRVVIHGVVYDVQRVTLLCAHDGRGGSCCAGNPWRPKRGVYGRYAIPPDERDDYGHDGASSGFREVILDCQDRTIEVLPQSDPRWRME